MLEMPYVPFGAREVALRLPRKVQVVEPSFSPTMYHHGAKGVVQQQPFVASNYATLYNYPSAPTGKTVFAVISLGGGLYGPVSKTGILTGGDVQAYWTSIGIPVKSQPTVVVLSIDGAKNIPNVNDGGATQENSMDVETIGSCCPGSNVIILFYIAPSTISGFYNAFNSAINTPVLVNGARVSPSAISCSWGAPEDAFSSAQLTKFDNLFKAAVAKGINICVASGDSGSNDGEIGNHVDFPGSSPNVISCGGTTVTLNPSSSSSGTPLTYSAVASEKAWGYMQSGSLVGGGGGVSTMFGAPSYQAGLGYSKRAVPDIAMNADPNTGVNFLVGGQTFQFGGTSVVAPAMAAFVACIGVKDFLNLHLYKISKLSNMCFHDITTGNNGAFSAKKGYDICTGLGSLNGLQIKAHL